MIDLIDKKYFNLNFKKIWLVCIDFMYFVLYWHQIGLCYSSIDQVMYFWWYILFVRPKDTWSFWWGMTRRVLWEMHHVYKKPPMINFCSYRYKWESGEIADKNITHHACNFYLPLRIKITTSDFFFFSFANWISEYE